ncbi:STAS domain-containing protein (plasmid) [Rhodococcus sp. DMU1]|nr:STAS domain-containing protein [Rhodococcus sp. DMU1]
MMNTDPSFAPAPPPPPAPGTALAPSPALEVDLDARLDGPAVLTVRGDIDIATAPVLEPHLSRASADGTDLVLDLTGVPFLGCAGMAMFDAAANRVRRRHATLTTAVQPHVRHILHVVGLDTTLMCCDTVAEAVAAVHDRART